MQFDHWEPDPWEPDNNEAPHPVGCLVLILLIIFIVTLTKIVLS